MMTMTMRDRMPHRRGDQSANALHHVVKATKIHASNSACRFKHITETSAIHPYAPYSVKLLLLLPFNIALFARRIRRRRSAQALETKAWNVGQNRVQGLGKTAVWIPGVAKRVSVNIRYPETR
jgi:hypothetical protein